MKHSLLKFLVFAILHTPNSPNHFSAPIDLFRIRYQTEGFTPAISVLGGVTQLKQEMFLRLSVCANTNEMRALDIFWPKDKSLDYNLPDPDVLAFEIIEDVEAALDGFREIVGILNQQ